MTTSRDGFEGWAVLELMGHRRLGGYVREETIAGQAFVRIDVPGDRCANCGHLAGAHTPVPGYAQDGTRVAAVSGLCAGEPPDGSECECRLAPPLELAAAATQFYAPAAVYCITPTVEEVARAAAAAVKVEPVHEWELPRRALTAARADDEDLDF